MASQAALDPEREYRLIEQLELRIASADSDEKFETIIQKFLPALVLKLESETERNRNLTIKVCQYISNRLRISQSIQLPVEGLLKNFQHAENAFVRRFSLLFIQQGLARTNANRALTMLPGILRFAIPSSPSFDATSLKMWAIAFDFFVDAMKQWRAPERGSAGDLNLRESFSLSVPQCDLLAAKICHFLLYDPREASKYFALDEDFRTFFEKQFKQRSQVVPPLAAFLFTAIYTDSQRLIPATILTADANSAASTVGDLMFKQCNFDLEDDTSIVALFELYRSAKTKLQTRILTLLSRSKKSTDQSGEILQTVKMQLQSPEKSLEASKLRSALFNYLTWAVRMSGSIQRVSAEIQRILKEYIDLQGWPNMQETSHSEAELRARAYESIGLLSSKDDSRASIDLISWLFTSLRCDTTRDVRGSIEEALSRVMSASASDELHYMAKLQELLLWNMTASPGVEDPVYYLPTVNSTSYPAVRFANKSLTFDNPIARLIDIIAAGDAERRELVEEGVRGLDPYWHQANQRLSTGMRGHSSIRRPTFSDLVLTFFGNGSYEVYFQKSATLAYAVSFCRNILVCEALQGTPFALDNEAEWKSRIDGLVANEQKVRFRLKEFFVRLDPGPLVQLVERALTGLKLGSADCANIAIELLALLDNKKLAMIAPSAVAAASEMLSNGVMQNKAARCLGILESLNDSWVETVVAEVQKCASWDTAIGTEAVKVRGHILCATYVLTRASLRGHSQGLEDQTQHLFALLHVMTLKSSDLSIRNVAIECLGQLAANLKPTNALDLSSEELVENLFAESKKENERAVATIGQIINHTTVEDVSEKVSSMVDRLFALHEVKRAEFHFVLGEALAVAAAGYQATSTVADLDVDAEKPDWGYHEGLLHHILSKIIETCKTTKPALKKASAIWLLSIIEFCGDLAPVQPRLRDCQAAFARLLNDRDEIVQESGSRGLSIVYEKGDKALKDDLVRDLVQSFTGSNAKMSGTINEDTQLFDSGALPTEGGQSVTTYKDIVSLATEMGDPSLVYKFMNLASNNAIWTSRAAFGRFGLGSVLADSSYLSENKKFYPKLFRYRFDPNPNVQRSMNEIWKALVKDPNAVIDEHFDFIMEDLLKSVVSGREWRAREASCAAIADLVQGRDLEKFEKHLDDIWNVAFKVLDDVKESVRVAAMKLCRNLTSMLIRSLEVGQGTTKRATAMLNHAMPFLLQQMESGAGKEVQQYAIATLLEVVRKSPARSLQPFAAQVLETLVVSLSSLEHESINYLHLNADKYGLTTDKLDEMRVSSISASPVTEAIESCLESLTLSPPAESSSADAMQGVESSSLTPMQDAMSRLEGAFKSAIGLPSKVGLSRVIVTLVVRYHAAFRPFADKFAQINRKNLLDRNATISMAFSTSLGYLMRLVSEKEIRATAMYARKLYFESQELSHRAVAGEILQAISKTSNDVFNNFGSMFFPFAFVGRNDTDEEVRARFETPWEDNIGGSRAVQLYLGEISSLIAEHIKSPLWPIRHACSLAVADLISFSESIGQWSESDARLIWPLMEEALGGKTWDGKSKVVMSYPTFFKYASVLSSDDKVTKQMKVIALREAKRTNTAYRKHAIDALGAFAEARPDIDLSKEGVPLLRSLMEQLAGEDAMEIDAAEDTDARFRESTLELTVGAAASSLFKLLSAHAQWDVLDSALEISRLAHAHGSTSIDTALYDGLNAYLSATSKGALSTAGRRRTANEDENGNGSEENENQAGLERFLQEVLLALFSPSRDDSSRNEPESLRKSRGRLGLTMVGPHACNAASHNQLASMLDTWLRSERSRPIRDELEKARDTNRQSR